MKDACYALYMLPTKMDLKMENGERRTEGKQDLSVPFRGEEDGYQADSSTYGVRTTWRYNDKLRVKVSYSSP